jgi:hypothetical protein
MTGEVSSVVTPIILDGGIRRCRRPVQIILPVLAAVELSLICKQMRGAVLKALCCTVFDRCMASCQIDLSGGLTGGVSVGHVGGEFGAGLLAAQAVLGSTWTGTT